jgi:hypothetical protein
MSNNPQQAIPSAAVRRQILSAGVASCVAVVLSGVWRQALAVEPPLLPAAQSLPDELQAALRTGSPLVVMVSLEGCPFCKVARENYLAPLYRQEGLPVVQVDMRHPRALRNFAGAMVTHDQMVRTWGVKLAPTVLFFGRGGAEVAPRLTGGYIPDFYGAYLDERLEQARKAVKA